MQVESERDCERNYELATPSSLHGVARHPRGSHYRQPSFQSDPDGKNVWPWPEFEVEENAPHDSLMLMLLPGSNSDPGQALMLVTVKPECE